MFIGQRLLRPTNLQSPTRSILRNAAIKSISRPRLHGRAHITIDARTRSLNRVNELAEQLKTTNDIHSVYPSFIEAIRKAKFTASSSSPLQKADIAAILRKLASSGRPEDMQRIEEILRDLDSVLETRPSPDLYAAIIEGLVERGSVQVIYDWFLKMPSLPGHFPVTLEHLHHFLEVCTTANSFQQMRVIVKRARFNFGRAVTSETFCILIRALWKISLEEGKTPSLDELEKLVADIESLRLPWDAKTSNLFFELFDNVGMANDGKRLQALYDSRFKGSAYSRAYTWTTQLAQTTQAEGVEAGIALFKTFEKEGCLPSHAVIKSLLQHSRTVADLHLVEEKLGVHCNARHWSTLVFNCVRARQTHQAFQIYQESKKAGIRPDSSLIAPLLQAFFFLSSGPTPDATIDKALALYRDLVAAHPSPSKEPSHHRSCPDIEIYASLFRLLWNAENLDKYYPIVSGLLDDMKLYNVRMDVDPVVRHLICLSMRRASTTEEALNEYNARKGGLSAEGYSVVLRAFSKLNLNGRPLPAVKDYFSIVNDMRRAGFQTPKAYTTFLTQIGYIASDMKRRGTLDSDTVESLISTTRRVHDLLSLDSSLAPHRQLLSQLISTYQRLGCFGDAYRVWELMYLTGTFDNLTISNILDACGHANDLHTAKSVWRQLSRDRFPFDLKDWQTWVECLCRCRQLDYAVKVVLQDMPEAGFEADAGAAKTVVKFSLGTSRATEIRRQILERFPALSSALSQPGKMGAPSRRPRNLSSPFPSGTHE